MNINLIANLILVSLLCYVMIHGVLVHICCKGCVMNDTEIWMHVQKDFY